MNKIFTKEWVSLLNTEIQSIFEGFEWNKTVPSDSLNITYHIKLTDSLETFTYHLQLEANEIANRIQVVVGEPDNAPEESRKVSFTQTQDIALGLMEGKLDSHIEFLTGKIQVEGDVLALQEYEEILEKLSQAIAVVNSTLAN